MRVTLITALLLAPFVVLGCGGGGGGDGGTPAGSSLLFGGTSHVNIPAPFDFTDSFTIEAWVKPSSLTLAGTSPCIVSAPPATVLYLVAATPGAWGATVCVPSCEAAEAPTGNLTVGVWQHVAMVYVSGFVAIYRNGSLVAQTWHPGDALAAAALEIGKWNANHFTGLIDEVRVWNVSRTGPQILAGMGTILAGNTPGLIGYWRFEEGSGQVVNDAATGGTAGTLGDTTAVGGDDPTWIAEGAPVATP